MVKYVCVCVCVRERERERERLGHLNHPNAFSSSAVLFLARPAVLVAPPTCSPSDAGSGDPPNAVCGINYI